MSGRKCWPKAIRYQAFMRQGKPPDIFTVRRLTRFQCCVRSCLDALPDGRRSTFWRAGHAWMKSTETTMALDNNGAFIRNIAEVPWREFPNHFGGALSKPLVMPETAGSRHIDYRISMYQPMAHVARHKHQVQEQIYHVLEGEHVIDLLLNLMLVPGDMRHRLIHRNPVIEVTRSRIRVWS